MMRSLPEPLGSLIRQNGRLWSDLFIAQAGDFYHWWLPPFYESRKRAVRFEDLAEGQEESIEWHITKLEVIRYACAVRDFNRAHTIGSIVFKNRPVAHGMLVASVFSRIFGTEFPGDGTIYLEQTIKWIKPVFIDTTIIGTVRIREINPEKRTIFFDTEVHIKDGERAVIGSARVLVPR